MSSLLRPRCNLCLNTTDEVRLRLLGKRTTKVSNRTFRSGLSSGKKKLVRKRGPTPVAWVGSIRPQEKQIAIVLAHQQTLISVAGLPSLSLVCVIEAIKLYDGNCIASTSLKVTFHLNIKPAANYVYAGVRLVLNTDSDRIVAGHRPDYNYG